MNTRTILLAGLVLALLGGGADATAQSAVAIDLEAVQASRRVTALRIAEPIRIDGVLDEPAWERAVPATDFYQQRPAEFAPASRPTEVRFLYDDSMLYVGAILYDEAPERLITNELSRDFAGFAGDLFAIVIDTFLDRRTGFGFLTNPGGAKRDTLALESGRNNANWDGVWFVRTQITPEGWTVEMGIPFKTLRFPEREVQEWGLHLMRLARRDNEFSLWSPVPSQFSNPQYALAYAGTLEGIRGVQPGRHLQITPFATARIDAGGRQDRTWGGTGDGGLDVKWGLTSSLTLDATYRTDFSQVEADEQQINLTRFSLFFPEKRQFFLESPTSFQIGLSSVENERRDLVPFFSRRIGLSDAGQPIPVVGGLRLTGQTGRHGVGLLTMQTEAFDGTPATNFTAARLTRAVAETTTLGGFYFGRESAAGGGFNRVAGLDLRLMPTRTLEVESFAMRSETHGEEGGWAGRAGLRLDTNRHRVRAGLVHVDQAFRHDLGFVRRRGTGTLFAGYERILRPADRTGLVREYTFGVDADATSDDRYRQSLTRLGGLGYGMEFRDGGLLNVRLNRTFEQLRRSFTVGRDLLIPPGDYRFEDLEIDYRSNRSARVSGTVGLQVGEFWTGRQRTTGGSLRMRVNQHVAASASLRRNHIDLPEGVFAANLVALRLDWSFNPEMFLNAFVQYNGAADAWLSNVRFNLVHRPLSDIYVVWNESRLGGETQRALLLKYTHLIAF